MKTILKLLCLALLALCPAGAMADTLFAAIDNNHLMPPFGPDPIYKFDTAIGGSSRTTFDDMVRLDLEYATSWSLWLDLKILLKTPMAVFAGDGAY